MACLRLKRYLDQDISGAIIVSYKRPRLCSEAGSAEEDVIETVLKFAGTVKSKDECVVEHLSKSKVVETRAVTPLAGALRNFKHRKVDVKSKIKRHVNLTSKANRYKVVCSARGVPEETLVQLPQEDGAETESTNAGSCRVYDLEPEMPEGHADVRMLAGGSQHEQRAASGGSDTTSNGGQPQDEAKYVYDLYFLQDLAGVDLGLKSVDIQPYTTNEDILVFNQSSSDESDAEDMDSNDEDNTRNDYPDEDDNYEKDFAYGVDEFCDGDVIAEGVGKFAIDDDSYCYGEDEDDDDDSEDEELPVRVANHQKSLRAQMAEIVSGDNIFNNAKYGNSFM